METTRSASGSLGTANWDSVDPKRFFGLLRRNFWILLSAVTLSAVAAFLFSINQTPVYSASTQVIVTRTNSQGASIDVTQSLSAQQVAQTYVELLKQEWIRGKVSERLGAQVNEDQINVTQAGNAIPLIYIEAEDPDPQRAIQIANLLVQVLIEQNESIQAARYASAEESINLQIKQIEQQIAQVQADLKQATENAYASQLNDLQAKIQETQTAIEDTNARIIKLRSLGSYGQAVSLLEVRRNQLANLQAKLDAQLGQYQTMGADLNSNPLAQSDPLYASGVQAQMAELGVAINQTRADIEAVSQEISFLTPLAQKNEQDVALNTDGWQRALRAEQDALTSQQALLKTYQDAYMTLLVAGESQVNAKDKNELSRLQSNLNLYQQIYLNLLNNRETLRLDRIQNMPNIAQANPPVASKNPVRPRTALNTTLAALAGLTLALAFIFVTDLFDVTLKSREDVERAAADLPVLGYVLPMASSKDNKAPFVLRSPRSPAAESFRSLRTNLEFIGAGKPLKSVLISSSQAGEGKTIIAANLALIVAQGGKKVVILDADLRRPRLHQELGVSNRIGLSDVFLGRATLEEAMQPYLDTNLSVVSSGGIPPNPAELLASEKMEQIFKELTAKFDMVVVDSPPMLVADSQIISARMDGMLLVARVGVTQFDSFRAAVEQYRRAGARLLGVVLNNVETDNGYGSYNKYSYYHYEEKSRKTGFKLPLSISWRSKPKNENAANPENQS